MPVNVKMLVISMNVGGTSRVARTSPPSNMPTIVGPGVAMHPPLSPTTYSTTQQIPPPKVQRRRQRMLRQQHLQPQPPQQQLLLLVLLQSYQIGSGLKVADLATLCPVAVPKLLNFAAMANPKNAIE